MGGRRAEPAAELWCSDLLRTQPDCRRLYAQERPDHTLQTTALVHEAYLRVLWGKALPWENRKHFFCAMARTMRRILVDHARECNAEKRGGARKRFRSRLRFRWPGARREICWLSMRPLDELAALNPQAGPGCGTALLRRPYG